jgi:hypothetical protein
MVLSKQTKKILYAESPRIVFVQIPPIFCALSALSYCRKTGSKLVVDIHTGALYGIWTAFKPLTSHVLSQSALALVTNVALAETLRSSNVKSFMLEDPVAKLNTGSRMELREGMNIAVISSFGADEPISEVLEAAKHLVDVNFYVTGDLKFAKQEHLRRKPDNVVFTGFLDHASYISLLNSADALMVLTTRENTFLSGGGEALSLGKPLITSRTKVLLDYFAKGTIHIDNTTEEIIEASERVLMDKNRLTKEMEELRILREQEWERKFMDLKNMLEL